MNVSIKFKSQIKQKTKSIKEIKLNIQNRNIESFQL